MSDEKLTGRPPTLTFEALADANEARCESEAFGHSIRDWSPTDWGCALAGEAGEACNKLKKLHRGDDITANEIAEELADVVIYADLTAQRLGIALGTAVRDKFNAKSQEVGSNVFLDGMTTPSSETRRRELAEFMGLSEGSGWVAIENEILRLKHLAKREKDVLHVNRIFDILAGMENMSGFLQTLEIKLSDEEVVRHIQVFAQALDDEDHKRMLRDAAELILDEFCSGGR